MSLSLLREIIERSPYGVLANVVQGQPRVRPMAFIMLEDGRLWSSTYRCSGKTKEFEQSNLVEVRKLHVRIEGIVSTRGGLEEKRELLKKNPKVLRHFPHEFDENFVHIEVIPTRIRWKKMGFCEYEQVPLE